MSARSACTLTGGKPGDGALEKAHCIDVPERGQQFDVRDATAIIDADVHMFPSRCRGSRAVITVNPMHPTCPMQSNS